MEHVGRSALRRTKRNVEVTVPAHLVSVTVIVFVTCGTACYTSAGATGTSTTSATSGFSATRWDRGLRGGISCRFSVIRVTAGSGGSGHGAARWRWRA